MQTKTYEVQKGGESIFDICRKLGMNDSEIIDLNDLIPTNDLLLEGTILKLPQERNIEEDSPVLYEVYPEPQKMHVNVPEGTKKFSFASVTKWSDLTFAGPTYPFNSNVEIVAKAHVPIGDEVAAYLMDSLALGDYENSGLPAFTMGFNHSHLSDGYIDKTEAKGLSEVSKKQLQILIENQHDDPSPGIAELPTTAIDYTDEPVDHKWKSTYVSFDDGEHPYVANESQWVHDLSTKRPDRMLEKNQDVIIAGTFIKNDVLYGRPSAAVRNSLWFGIPMTNLISEKELYNGDIPLHEKAIMKKASLSISEHGVVMLAKLLSSTTRLKTRLSKIKIIKK